MCAEFQIPSTNMNSKTLPYHEVGAVVLQPPSASCIRVSSRIPSALLLLGPRDLPGTLIQHSALRPKRNGAAFRSACGGRSKRPFAFPRPSGEISAVSCSKSTDSSDDIVSEEPLKREKPKMFQSWDVPWDWKVTLYVMLPHLMSIVLTGFIKSTVFTAGSEPYNESLQPHLQIIDEVATRLLVDQLLKTSVKLLVLYVFISPYRPFPEDVFSYKWSKPFDLQCGWILWGSGGLIIASSAVFLVKTLISSSNPGQVDSLLRLLPLIGASNTSTICLLSILGVLAPLCEETLYRGFFMTSLTNWVPVPVSVAVTAAVFTLAHKSPGKSLEIFIFGMVLGLVYAQTRNLLAPIAMHACWNLGVVLLLTYLQLQGHEIEKYVL